MTVSLDLNVDRTQSSTHILAVKVIQSFQYFADISRNKLFVEVSEGFDGVS
jgi:hypothetical protein